MTRKTLRHKYNLPNHFVHNALNDDSAELLLAQQKIAATNINGFIVNNLTAAKPATCVISEVNPISRLNLLST